MIEKTIKLYQYDELSDDAKQNAYTWYCERALGYEWWDFIYEDAKNIGFEITDFDLRRHSLSGDLIDTLPDTLKKILENHGENTDTYKLALKYQRLANDLPDPETQEAEESAIELEEEFTRALAEEYLCMLRQEEEHLQSEEACKDAMEANEYTFLEDGTRRD